MTINPTQLKAARALAGWSQKDLAIEAKIAQSTVADFERGSRTPHPNNIQAIIDAFECIGISISNQKVVSQDLSKNIETQQLNGKPIKLVSARDLSNWSTRLDARSLLSQLLRWLIRASLGPNAHLHFPSEESIQMPGWDGICYSKKEHEFTPLGHSYWEIGIQQKNIESKADSDYQKRLKSLSQEERLDATFIFVTPHRWKKKRLWVQEKTIKKEWKDVQVFDADILEHWIELCPAVGYWIATYIGKRPLGARNLEDVWKEWSMSTYPAINKELVLAGRDQEAAEVSKWLTRPPSAIVVAAESQEESIAFLMSSISSFPEQYRDSFLARSLVTETSDNARMLAQGPSPLILILQSQDPGLAATLIQCGHHVYIPITTRPSGEKGHLISLSNAPHDPFEDALIHMGLQKEEARDITIKTNHNISIYRRFFPSVHGLIDPPWARTEDAIKLIPALLLGGWDENCPGDLEAIRLFVNADYNIYINNLQLLLNATDSPLRKLGTQIIIKAPKDAWSFLARFITPIDLEKFKTIALQILIEKSAHFETKEKKHLHIRNREFNYSDVLRNGVAETLILLSVFSELLIHAPNAADYSRSIVYNLLNKASPNRWISISALLPQLAEAAPEEFLDAVEDALHSPDKPIVVLFNESQSDIFSTIYHAKLLWALEILAWNPNYIARTADQLLALTHLDQKNHSGNSPIVSLKNIFLLWSPQTYVPLNERLKILDRLIKLDESAAWELMINLLPHRGETMLPSQKPRWKSFKTEQTENTTHHLIFQGIDLISEKILKIADKDINRWKKIVVLFTHFPPLRRKQAAEQLLKLSTNISEDYDRLELWEAIRQLLHHHREFITQEWALPANELDDLENIYHILEPKDPILKIIWLFPWGTTEIPNPTGKGMQADETLADELRQAALIELVKTHGINSILLLAQDKTLVRGTLIGATLAATLNDEVIKSELIKSILHRKTENYNDLLNGFFEASFQRDGILEIEKTIQQSQIECWNSEITLQMCLTFPCDIQIWKMISDLGPEIERRYWLEIEVYRFKQTEIDFLLEKLINYKRYIDAIHLIGYRPKQVSENLLMQILTEASSLFPSTQITSNKWHLYCQDIRQIFAYLVSSSDIDMDKLATLEWKYLPALQYLYHYNSPALHKKMSTNPRFFVEVLLAVFDSKNNKYILDMDTENESRKTKIVYHLLHSWRILPGQEKGTINTCLLTTWVDEVIKISQEVGLGKVGDEYIGRILAFSPVDDDGAWPIKPIRAIIDNRRNRDLEGGILIGLIDRRGVTTRALADGGLQEYQLASLYKAWADQIKIEWPRTASFLRQIGEVFKREGKMHDLDILLNEQ